MNPSLDSQRLASCATVYQAFELARQHFATRPFLMIPAACPGGPQELTYERAHASVTELIGSYRRAGYGRGHHVALLLGSRAEFYLHWLALNAIGATLVPIGADLVDDEVVYLIQHGDVDLIITHGGRITAIESVASGIKGVKLALLEQAGDALPSAGAPKSAPTAVNGAAIVFTSGSTGRPKGCILSNDYFLTFGQWYRDLGGRCALREGCERFITPLPPNHVNALAFSSMGALLTGGCIVQMDRFRAGQWWELVSESRATVMHYLGVMPNMLLKLPRDPRESEHQLRFGIGGGVRGSDHEDFEERFRVPLIEAWAMTETGGAGTISTHLGPRYVGSGNIGQPSPQYSEALIVDDTGVRCVAGSVGELVVRATGKDSRRGFFSGYYRDPDATEAAWRGGWLRTGDLAKQNSEGCFFFVGRSKQIIRRSGENISAAEVESVLAAIPHVVQVAVVAVPDKIREEEVFACIVTDGELAVTRETAQQIVGAAARHLSYFKLPGYIAFLPQLPMTPTQKVRYGAVRELAQSRLIAQGPELFDITDIKREYRTRY